MDSIFENLTTVQTLRDSEEPQKENITTKLSTKEHITTSETPKEYSKLLFDIHSFHSHSLGLKHYLFDPNEHKKEITPLKTLSDLKKEDYEEYEVIRKKIGRSVIIKYVPKYYPILSNEIEADWNLIQILNEASPPSWRTAFELAFKDLLLLNDRFATAATTSVVVCPQKKDIFRAFELCPLNQIKVVILGQDPYHSIWQDKPVANGLAFSTPRGFKVQPSLKNIYKLLKNSIKGFEIPSHGDLSKWAQQGVLLLNKALTTIAHKAEAHLDYWDGFTTHIITVINKVKPDCVYMLWGAHAQKMKRYIFHQKYILEANHPSPMVRNSDFQKCNHFVKANLLLKNSGQKEIDWCLD